MLIPAYLAVRHTPTYRCTEFVLASITQLGPTVSAVRISTTISLGGQLMREIPMNAGNVIATTIPRSAILTQLFIEPVEGLAEVSVMSAVVAQRAKTVSCASPTITATHSATLATVTPVCHVTVTLKVVSEEETASHLLGAVCARRTQRENAATAAKLDSTS